MKLRLSVSFFLLAALLLTSATLRADSLSGVLDVFGPAGDQNPQDFTWVIVVTNNGATTATNVEITLGAPLIQTAGAACTPVFSGPLLLGNIAPGATAGSDNIHSNANFDFTGCSGDAAFTMDFAFSANGGAQTGSLVLQNIAVDQPMGEYPAPSTAAPEPSTTLLLAFGLVSLGFLRRCFLRA